MFKSRAEGEARSAIIPRESGIPTGAGSRGAGGAALRFIPPTTSQDPLPHLFLGPPLPLPPVPDPWAALRALPAHVPPRKGRVKLSGFILGGTMTPRHVKSQAACAPPARLRATC